MKHRYVTGKDAVYWIEEDYDYNLKEVVPMIKAGYYLSSYKTQLGIKHLVSNGEITSCVVRHIDDGNMYDSYIEVQNALNEMMVELEYERKQERKK